MNELLRFLAGTFATMLDPIAAAGYVTAGLVGRRLWHAIAFGIGWAIAMEVLTQNVVEAYDGQFALNRMVGGAVVASIAWAIKALTPSHCPRSHPTALPDLWRVAELARVLHAGYQPRGL